MAAVPAPTRQSLFTPIAAVALLLVLLLLPAPSDSAPLGLKPSAISAAPSLLPGAPDFASHPPTSSPDVMPVFPTPGGDDALSPADSLPIIPSSPSPPNPDALDPNSAATPSSSASETSGAPAAAIAALGGGMSVALLSVTCWWFQLLTLLQ